MQWPFERCCRTFSPCWKDKTWVMDVFIPPLKPWVHYQTQNALRSVLIKVFLGSNKSWLFMPGYLSCKVAHFTPHLLLYLAWALHLNNLPVCNWNHISLLVCEVWVCMFCIWSDLLIWMLSHFVSCSEFFFYSACQHHSFTEF